MYEMIRQLKQTLAEETHQYRTFIDGVEKRGEWTGADREVDARFQERLQEIQARIGELEEAWQSNKKADEMRARYQTATAPDISQADGPGSDEGQLRSLFTGQNREPVVIRWEARDLTPYTAGAGGNLVPTTLSRMFHTFLTEQVSLLNTNVTILDTASGEDLDIPKLASHGTAAIVGAGSAIGESDPSFDKTTLSSFKYSQLLEIPSELVADSGVNLREIVARDMAYAVGEAFGSDSMTGNGTNKPQGIFYTAGTAVSGTVSDYHPSADELIDLFFSRNSRYQARGSWVTSNASLANARKLKDTQDRYLIDLQSGLRPGAPAEMLGRPIYVDAYAPAAGSATTPWLFGDLSGHYVRRAGGVKIDTSTDYAFNRDMVTYRVTARMDARTVDPTAFAVFAGTAA